ncbi:DUF262 domain-containing protein [Phascolarctobacterium succinatutens]|uniref:DUF262 domain-containing protein n=1 Tax=Phascolarctobacterium succinatutens TaxID=626940 RepID=UPI0026F13A34|nr:DUF262 domain-containing HNH endonuclease family protein [Phascolarctobacterium succinatutens]
MGSKITGKEYPLSKIFSKDFDYYVPSYQRPYAWTEEETGTLFDDLYDFYKSEENDNYFLGSIVLIKEDDKPHADIIDGQQRLTTLTILLSVVAEKLPDEDKATCIKYLREPGNRLEGLAPQARLHLRQKDQDFFGKYIQGVKLEELISLDSTQLVNESQKHILENCKLLRTRINEKFKTVDEIVEFCAFLVMRCYLVVVYTPSQRSAFRVFSVMNSRGLNLMPIDIIKSDVIGKIPERNQQSYTDLWEDLEIQTSRSGFNDVFAHTRTIFAKVKAKKTLLEEFREYVLPKFTPQDLIDDVLTPYAETYSTLVNKNYVAANNAEEINEYLFWLNKIDNSDWMPSAMKFVADHSNDSQYVLWFVKKLECLAAYLHITAKDVNKRMDRYRLLLEEMESNPHHSLQTPLKSIELTAKEKNEFSETLNGEIYKLTAVRRNYVILRLNSFVSDGVNKFDWNPSKLTIEHVLPQTVSDGTKWAQWWPDETERALWLNRIANLVPLTKQKNSAAQNFDFEKKKDVYFKGKSGTTTYPLTTQVLNEVEWTPAIVEQRQKNILQSLIDGWELK